MRLRVHTHYYRMQSLGQGNVFTGVCLSKGGGGLSAGGLLRGSARWGSLHLTGLYRGAGLGRPPMKLGKRAVRLLLECFLVVITIKVSVS